jgi:hypothetical protein
LVAGVVEAPKENWDDPDGPAAAPNNPPAAGAVLVVLLGAALEEPGVPKLKDMAIGTSYLFLFESSVVAIGKRQLLVKK